jgi:phage shock protein A
MAISPEETLLEYRKKINKAYKQGKLSKEEFKAKIEQKEIQLGLKRAESSPPKSSQEKPIPPPPEHYNAPPVNEIEPVNTEESNILSSQIEDSEEIIQTEPPIPSTEVIQNTPSQPEPSYETLYMPSVLFENNQSVPNDREQAAILSQVYHHSAEKHIQLQLYTLILGSIFAVIGAILAVWAIVDSFNVSLLVGGIVVVVIGLITLLYGFVIHKPSKLEFLSKVYTTSYIIPFDSSLIFDGTDIVPDQTLRYEDFPLHEFADLTNTIPSPPVTYEREQDLLSILNRKHALMNQRQPYALTTPALLNSDVYSSAILESLSYSTKGVPNYGILNIKLGYEQALKDTHELQTLSGLGASVSLMSEERNNIQNRTMPYTNNLRECLQNIDRYFNNVDMLLRDHFFSGVEINGNPEDNKEYGYHLVQHKYHIPVKTTPTGIIPLNPSQEVIDTLDTYMKGNISTIIQKWEMQIENREKSRNDKIDMITRNADGRINQLENQINGLRNEISSLSNQADNFRSQAQSQSSQASQYRSQARQALQGDNPNRDRAQMCDMQAQNAENQAQQYQMQYNNIQSQIDAKSSQISNCRMDISSIEQQRDSDIHIENTNAQNDINRYRGEMTREVVDARKQQG